jgi:hypothetical protein
MRIQWLAWLIVSLGLMAGCGDDKTATSAAVAKAEPEFKELAWEDLELPGQGLKEIMQKYQPQIDAIPEGGKGESEVMEKMQAELNNAPINPALNGKKVKIPGFITVLDAGDDKGMIKEFLLVPFFGACIHVPPPPVNQTILVKPLPGKSIGMERVFEPVWVSGTLSTAKAIVDVPQGSEQVHAGYQILDGQLEIYQLTDPTKDSAAAPAPGTPITPSAQP